ncbi:hypothetical protein BOVAC1_2207 [Bacteroides ovatus]|nr:hypothetical protein BOVAC1_2207 [Bacteroides ovatus]
MNLPFGTGIGRMTVAVKSALITDANTVLVVLFKPIYVSCYYNQ